ncbi:MAG: ribosome recycling factor [Epsilonproteobacteria bacterium]|nr:ribosome recycling factor [Campylobacterota bacterium]NPA56735.1 ribosome recycling factor [Campylobacterota bacterium]
MELNEVYEYARDHMEKSLDVLKRDFGTLRTGRVTTAVVDHIKVDYYGAPTPLNQVATITATDATTIVIAPWDKGLLGEIERAIQEANIGVNPNNDGDVIKLFFPPMTMEQRQAEGKRAKQFGEKAKIAIRNVRRDANDKIKKMAKEKVITEDEEKRGLDEVQKITDEFVKKVDDLVKAKEQEIMKV